MSAQESWYEEKQSAWLYRVVIDVEPDVLKQRMFTELAEAAEGQSLVWEKQIVQAGLVTPEFVPSARARIVAFLLRNMGPRALRPVLAAMKVRGVSVYSAPPLAHGHVMPTSVSEVGGRHMGVASGGNLRAAVFGINDGLVSNTSLIMGMAGAMADAKVVMLTGTAGLLAGAFSMAAGEFVSVRSQRELYEYQIGLERDELLEYPEEEAEELALIYNARGMPMDQARQIAQELIRDPEHALNTLAREELGMNPDDLGSPWGAAMASFSAFAVGGVLPLLPFLFGAGTQAVLGAAILGAISLFAVGATLSLFTGRAAWWSGLRMLLIGGGAGAVTYLVGGWLGVSLV
ncbi:MAG: VIT1/CCC1 transporter family protein [Gammaproteobacteria bacterium]|nr:VIT1/CCC1 transporter family protein [Gammaproteobacteria bacterium]